MPLNDRYFLNPAHLDLARARYFLKDDNGRAVEEDIEEVFERVVNYIYQDDQDNAQDALELRRQKKLIDAGRPLAQAGTKTKNMLNCFVKNTVVSTTSGIKKIQDVVVGDKVISHTGEVRDVMQTHANPLGERSVFEIKCARTPHVFVTGNHKFWALSNDGKRTHGPYWISVEDLVVGDYIAIPKPKEGVLVGNDKIDLGKFLNVSPENVVITVLENHLEPTTCYRNRGFGKNTCSKEHSRIKRFWNIDNDFAFFVGLWLGDGCVYSENGKNIGLSFTTNLNEKYIHEFVCKYGSNLFGIDPVETDNVEQNTKIIYFNSQLVACIFENMFGRGFDGKHLASYMFGWNAELISSLLSGMVSSDGTISSNGTCKVEIRNKALVEQLYHAGRQCGIPVSMSSGYVLYKGEKRLTSKLGIPKGSEIIRNALKAYSDDRVAKSVLDKTSKWKSVNGLLEKDNQYFVRINKKDKINVEEEVVYTLGVKSDHSYNVEGLVCENCFVIGFEDDTREAISELKRKHFNIQAQGGGTGINFSTLRPAGSICKSTQSRSSGAVGFITDFSYQSSNISQGGNRSGANMGIMADWHPDLYEFIAKKSESNWENIRKFATIYNEDEFSYFQWAQPYQWQMFNVSVFVSDKLITMVEETPDEPWVLEWEGTPWHLWEFTKAEGPVSKERYPKTFVVTAPNEEMAYFKASTHIPFFNNKDLKLVRGPFDLTAGQWFTMVCKHAWTDGCPGIVFEDLARRYHNAEYFNPIEATNPCAEQVMPRNAVCCLASLVLPSFFVGGEFLWDEFERAIRIAVRGLDNVITLNRTGEDDIDANAINERRIGLGTTGIAELLILKGLKYSSDAGREFAGEVLEFLRNKAYEASIDLAKERGVFPAYEFRGFSQSEFFKGLPEYLQNLIRRNGIRNVTILTQAPTGTTGTMVGFSTGCEPYFAMCFLRNSRVGSFLDGSPAFMMWLHDHGIDYKDYDYSLSKLREAARVPDYFEEAHEILWMDHLKMQAVFAKYIDSSVSKTINLPNNATVEDVKNAYLTAYKLEIKSTTIYRDGSKQQILEHIVKESDKKRPTEIVRAHAPQRPKELECDIYHTSVKGDKWTVLVGLLDDRPYEVFCAPQDNFEIAPKYKKGTLVKNGQGSYYLDTGDFKLKNISSYLNTDEHRVITRLLSTCLRHGVPMSFVSEQLAKADGTVVDFSKAIMRVLKKYGDVATFLGKDLECQACGSNNVVLKGGCPECLDCGVSKCE